MGSRKLPPRMLRAERPSRALGVLVSLATVGLSTLLVYPLKHVAPVQTLGVVYLLPVLVMSIFWGLAFGLATAVLREAALASELAQLLLGAERLQDALVPAAERLAQALGTSAAVIRLGEAVAPGDASELPAGVSAAELERARERVVPALSSILAAAVHRESLRAEVVETAALRRSDE